MIKIPKKYFKASSYVNKVKSVIKEGESQPLPVELYGQNWRSKRKIKIAILFGFSPWKRAVISEFLSDYKTAFVLGKASIGRVERDFLKYFPTDSEVEIFCWGNKYPKTFPRDVYFSKILGRNISVKRIEDGFLRSIGSGLLHTRPASLCIDDMSMYFDAYKPSRLEKLIVDSDDLEEDSLLESAKLIIQLIRSGRLTKYYDPEPYKSDFTLKKASQKTVLVIGQVEDDASLLKGRAVISSNYDLIKAARKENPDARIIFRPHPDYWSGIRKKPRKEKSLDSICQVIPPSVSLYELFEITDHVYTMTSLSGFEALIYGLKVTTFGAPFYSNWGLTDDRVRIKRRIESRTLEQVVAAAYIMYPKYLHPLSGRQCDFFDIASYFIFESLKSRDYFSLDSDVLFNRTEGFFYKLSWSLKILKEIKKSSDFAALNEDVIDAYLSSCPDVESYSEVSYLLVKSANYNALVRITDYFLMRISDSFLNEDRIDFRLLSEFFYAVSFALRNSNGRVVSEIPDLSNLVRLGMKGDKEYVDFLVNYAACLSFNIQYKTLERMVGEIVLVSQPYDSGFAVELDFFDKIIDELSPIGLDVSVLRRIARVISQKPSRSERNYVLRRKVLSSLASCMLDGLSMRYGTQADSILNAMLCSLWVGNEGGFKEEVSRLVANFDEGSLKNLLQKTISRKSHWFSIIYSLIKAQEHEVAKYIFDCFPDGPQKEAASGRIDYEIEKVFGSREVARSKLDAFSEDEISIDWLSNERAKSFLEFGHFESAIRSYEEMLSRPCSLLRKNSIQNEIKKVNFLKIASHYLNSVPQPAFPKGVVVLASQKCFNTLAMMVPALIECKKKGYAVICITGGTVKADLVGLPFIDKYQGILPSDLRFAKRNFDWRIDWASKVISAENINFYQGFYEGLSTYSRKFNVEIGDFFVSSQLKKMIDRSDSCLQICEEMFNELVLGRGIPLTFVSGNSHIPPYSVFRDFARAKGHKKLGFVACNVAYEAYFSNLGSKFSNTMCVTDMSLHNDIRAPFMARKDQFDPWYSNNRSNPEFIEKADRLINLNRVGSESDAEAGQLIEFIKDQKAQGKRIICAFGKVPVDLNVPYDGGPGHTDMADWINHTVSVCSELSDVILLVKPHPHELKPEIALDLVEGFHDLITVEMGSNIRLLKHKEINGHALAPYLDLALLYNGSSGVELAAQGIPVIMTSYFGKHDYPIELNYPVSRDHYKKMIAERDYQYPDSELRRRAAFLLCYLGTDEISIENRYSKRQLTNDKIGVPSWRTDLMDQFLNEGDPKMEYIAKRIVEKFEGPVVRHGRV